MMNEFPRKLTEKEKTILFSVLPENKSGYNYYRDKIDSLLVIGQGRFDRKNLLLGKEGNKPDLSVPSNPVFACGTLICKETEIDILIHEEFDDEIEFDITTSNSSKIEDGFTVISKWNYSEWKPGDKAPKDKSFVREIVVIPDMYKLAIAPEHKKIWLHDLKSGVNHLIPVSNFYNQLMMVKDIRNSKIALNPGLFFQNLEEYTDEDLISALVTYNKYIRRFKIDLNYFTKKKTEPEKKGFLSFMKRGKS